VVKIFDNEPEFSTEVFNFFSKKLSQQNSLEIKVIERPYILKDFTVGKDKNNVWRVFAGLQQQDIVFYQREFERSEFENGLIKITGAGAGKTIVIPLAICELKIPRSFETHGLITYSEIASQIKFVFPYCVYYFLLSGSDKRVVLPETVLRQGKGFDRVFLNWENDKENIWKDLLSHFNYLKRIGVIT